MKKLKIKDKIWFKATMYIVSIALLIFYVTMLYLGQNSNVGHEYRMYYITHELSEWPGYGKLSYVLGTEEFYSYYVKNSEAAAVRRGTGWDVWEEKDFKYTKTNGEDAYLYYRISDSDSSNGYVMRVKLSELTGTGVVSIYVNGIKIGETQSGIKDCSFIIPQEACQKSENDLFTIKFKTNDSAFILESILIE